jgi:hypothetical protein
MDCDAIRLAFGSYRRQKNPHPTRMEVNKREEKPAPPAKKRVRPPQVKKTDAERRLKGVTVRLTVARYDELKAHAAAGGQTLARVVRNLIQQPVAALTPGQDALLRQLAGMANNLNQLAKRANQGGLVEVATPAAQAAAQVSRLLDSFADA